MNFKIIQSDFDAMLPTEQLLAWMTWKGFKTSQAAKFFSQRENTICKWKSGLNPVPAGVQLFIKLDLASNDVLIWSETHDAPATTQAVMSTTTKKPKAAAKKKHSQKIEDEFEMLKGFYPRRAGSNRFDDAKRFYAKKLKEGFTFESVLFAVQQYAEYCKVYEKLNTSYVLQMATFINNNENLTRTWEKTRNDNNRNTSASARLLAGLREDGFTGSGF